MAVSSMTHRMLSSYSQAMEVTETPFSDRALPKKLSI